MLENLDSMSKKSTLTDDFIRSGIWPSKQCIVRGLNLGKTTTAELQVRTTMLDIEHDREGLFMEEKRYG